MCLSAPPPTHTDRLFELPTSNEPQYLDYHVGFWQTGDLPSFASRLAAAGAPYRCFSAGAGGDQFGAYAGMGKGGQGLQLMSGSCDVDQCTAWDDCAADGGGALTYA